jgi:hypothetical protein
MAIPPQLFQITPQELTIGAANAVSITGLGLTGGTLATPGGDTVTGITLTDTLLTCTITIPAGKSAGARFIQITGATGGSSNRLQVNYQGNVTTGNLATQEQNYPLDYLHTAK